MNWEIRVGDLGSLLLRLPPDDWDHARNTLVLLLKGEDLRRSGGWLEVRRS
jgi:hypothetical protein